MKVVIKGKTANKDSRLLRYANQLRYQSDYIFKIQDYKTELWGRVTVCLPSLP